MNTLKFYKGKEVKRIKVTQAPWYKLNRSKTPYVRDIEDAMIRQGFTRKKPRTQGQ